jgi:hypothetical protein
MIRKHEKQTDRVLNAPAMSPLVVSPQVRPLASTRSTASPAPQVRGTKLSAISRKDCRTMAHASGSPFVIAFM